MRYFNLRRLALSVIVALVALIALFMLALVVRLGPETVSRLVASSFDTEIDDYLHYPGRPLHASDTPFAFQPAEQALALPASAQAEFGGGDLESIAEANDSIALLVIDDDVVVFERYFQGHGPSAISQMFSVSKSFTATLVGLALEDGLFDGVDQPITDFIPELSADGFDVVSLHHLLSMTSGSDYVEDDNPFGEHELLNFTTELEPAILMVGMERQPGTLFRYKTGDNALLALALSRALGDETLTDYAQRRLWTPLGMQDDGVWSLDHKGNGLEKSWCCLAASARDIAKLGRLYLRGGDWDGEQLLSSEWVTAATATAQVPGAGWPDDYRGSGWFNYGYQWWLASEADGDFFGLGKDGQFLYVNPATGTIVVRLGWTQGDLVGSDWVRLFQTIAASLR